MTTNMTNRTGSEIAVIGMAGKFPGAKNIAEFWENLKNGIESISFISDEEIKILDVDPNWLTNPNYVKVKGGVLEDKEIFDASFFGYAPNEAEIMDPQIRIFHECVWSALEDAGYDPGRYNGFIGLYAGASSSVYWENLTVLSGKSQDFGFFSSSLLNNKDFLSTQIAYKLNLKGPCFMVQTACSTSLVAIHLACQGILYGECNMALAGGIKIVSQKNIGYIYKEGMIGSRDGHCRAFDAKAKGTIGGEGVGVVLLKSLEDAITDGDHIYAVIKGTAINNDGLRKIGYTAPSVEGQAEVIHMAQQVAEVEAESITYVEAHGTGTEMGDPVEIEALKLAFNTDKKNFCAVGSVKTNIGHLDAAAGITGFIKTVLTLNNKQIPPSLHFKESNPKIDFKNSPFYVNTQLTEWKSNGYPRRAGVSSFGIGGTNAHAILEEWSGDEARKIEKKGQGDREYRLILLSAKTPSALDRMTENLGRYLKANTEIHFPDAAYTLMVGRKDFECRRMLVCKDVDDAITTLSNPDSRNIHTFFSKEQEKSTIFMFPGLGAQYINMGRELYEKEPVFRHEMDNCFEILKPLLDYNIKEILYPGEESADLHETIKDFEAAQLVIFIFEYALARLLIKWGVKPDIMIGYSFGEYVAACISGIFSLESALKLIVYRGKLIQKMPTGIMLSVPLPIEELLPLVTGELAIAIDNGPSCIIAGPEEAIASFEKQMNNRKALCIRLPNSHAIHSKMMEPILKEFEQIVAQFTLSKPKIPFISNLTGTRINDEEVLKPAYWIKHLRHTVRFADGMKELMTTTKSVFIEIGPGHDLSALAVRHIEKDSDQVVINLVRRPNKNISDALYLLNKIGQMWLYGVKIDWIQFQLEEKRYRIPLPTYPFEGKPYLIKDNLLEMGKELVNKAISSGKKSDIADLFYIPSWKSSLLPVFHSNRLPHNSLWLIFYDKCPLGDQLIKKLNQYQQELIIIKRGKAFSKVKANEYVINPEKNGDYSSLFNDWNVSSDNPIKIIYLWGISNDNEKLTFEYLETAILLEFKSLIYLAQAIGKLKYDREPTFQLFILTSRMHKLTGYSLKHPENSLVLGPVKVIPLEYPNITTRAIDVDAMELGRCDEDDGVVSRLLGEFMMDSQDMVIAYRDNERLVQNFEHVWFDKNEELPSLLKKEGVYWITAGLSGIGLELAGFLAQSVQAKLILTGRSEFPSKEQWDEWLAIHDKKEVISQKILKLKEFEKCGAEVLCISGDVSDIECMKTIVDQVLTQFGKINGVIHSAGVIEGSIIQRKTDEMIKHVLNAKVKGTLVLHTVLENIELDFFALCSSVNSILPALGQVGYCSANAFLDAFSHYRSGVLKKITFSINWPIWQNTGMAIASEAKHKALTGAEMRGGITSSQGTDAFGRILGHLHQQIVFFPIDLNRQIRIFTEKIKDRSKEVNKLPTPVKISHQRPNLSSLYFAPTNEVERSVTEIWQNFFGFKDLGIDDDFYELGGDSLKAITLTSQLKKDYPLLSLNDFLTHSTISELASIISMNALPEKSGEDLHEKNVLSKLECIEKLNKGHNEKNIFIVHPRHGMVNQYKELAGVLEKAYNVYGIQARGLLPGSKMSESPAELIIDYVEQILKVQPEGPFIIGGYCAGAKFAYNIVLELERRNHYVKQYIMFDSAVIFSWQYAKFLKLLEYSPRFVKKLIFSKIERLFLKAKLKGELTGKSNMNEMVNLPGLPAVSKKLFDHIHLLRNYTLPLGIIKSPQLMIRAEANSHEVTFGEAQYLRMTKGKATLIDVPGDHFSILTKPYVDQLGEAILNNI